MIRNLKGRIQHAWYVTKRYLPWVRRTIQAQTLLLAWSLITWSAFGWNVRAWAASIGGYLLASILIELYSIRAAARAQIGRD